MSDAHAAPAPAAAPKEESKPMGSAGRMVVAVMAIAAGFWLVWVYLMDHPAPAVTPTTVVTTPAPSPTKAKGSGRRSGISTAGHTQLCKDLEGTGKEYLDAAGCP